MDGNNEILIQQFSSKIVGMMDNFQNNLLHKAPCEHTCGVIAVRV